VIVKIVEKQMECRLAGETEVLGENLPHIVIYGHFFLPGAACQTGLPIYF
jgi:hypothetical protein